MAFFKKVAKKITTDVKDVIKEEAGKTSEEIKKGVINSVTEILPYALAFVGAVVLVALLRKTTVTVKVIVDHV